MIKKPRKVKKITETDIQRTICDYLTKKKYFFFRNNNTPIYDATRKVFRAMPKYAMKGVADIILIKDGGLVVFIEVKAPTRGVLSEHQIAFKALCDSVKAPYYVVRSLQEILDLGF